MKLCITIRGSCGHSLKSNNNILLTMCQLRLIATSSSLLDNGDVEKKKKKKSHRLIYVVKCLVVYEVIRLFGQKTN